MNLPSDGCAADAKDVRVVLATGSRTRIHAFRFLQVPFLARPSGINERMPKRPSEAREIACFLASEKARSLAKAYPDYVIIGFDSVGSFAGSALEKPDTYLAAQARLRFLSGQADRLLHRRPCRVPTRQGGVASSGVQRPRFPDAERG